MMVEQEVYESAVKGRQDFRAAFKACRDAHRPEEEVRAALAGALEVAGSYAELSRLIGVSDEYVRNMSIGARPIRGKVLAFLGYERVTTYRRKP
jgi:hypothetical protein